MRDTEAKVLPAIPGETSTPATAPSAFVPLFYADWMRAVFIHFEVEPETLQREVPFALDLWKGKAFVSLVAFTMERLRPRMGGWVSELAFKPIANTRFLNIRTYVLHRSEPGIFFIGEFLSNRFFVPLGRPTFGLPYRCGDLAYRHDREDGTVDGTVTAAGGEHRLAYRAGSPWTVPPRECRPATLDYFLLERYAAFTCAGARRRRFQIWHPPWYQVPIEPLVEDEGLLATTGHWVEQARSAGGHFSPGARGVWMGSPETIHLAPRRRRLTVFFEA